MASILARLPGIKLHHAILLAMVLGVFFGAYFSVSKYQLEVSYQDGRTTGSHIVENWESIELVKKATGEVLGSFGKEDQLKLLGFYNQLQKSDRANISLRASGPPIQKDGQDITLGLQIDDVSGIQKIKTIAVAIKPIGTLFIRLLMFLAIPLVLASLIVGAASLGDIRRVGRLGGETILLYLFTTAVAITIGLVLVNIIQPGTRLSTESREKLMVEFGGAIQQKIQQETSINLIDTFIQIVPTNPFAAMANAEMLQIVFFALIVGVTLTMVAQEKARPVIQFFEGLSETMIKMVDLIMIIAPLGVFALIAATIAEFGFDILQTLVWYAATVLFGLLLHLMLTYGALLQIVARYNPIKFIRGMRDALLIAFSTSSSAATLPVTMECCERNLGVPKSTTSFVLPLGATINMDGTSLYQAVAAVFIAQVYGLDLHLSDQLTILLTATLASIGTAPVPGVGIIMLIIVLRSVHVPEEGIALILGIDRILDMCRTTLNVTGDAVVATVVSKWERVLGDQRNEKRTELEIG